jgi:nucleoside-diphosphate-sugar epimerase
MSKFVVVGAGSCGTGVAEELACLGHQVTIVTRHGSGPTGEGISRRQGDAADDAFLTGVTRGADALFNCANPQYHRWLTDWPPIAGSLLATAGNTGATLVTLSNLYAYGPPTGPMSPHDPLTSTLAKAQVRAGMWNDALELHQAGTIRAVEVRASDFIGPDAQGQFSVVLPRLVRGKRVQVLGDPGVLHTWTYVGDVSRTLVACALDEASWGRPWHVPSNEPRTERQVVDDLADAAGVARVKVSGAPKLALRALGLFNPQMRELAKTLYQFEAPFIMDDGETRQSLGLMPTPWPEVLDATVGLSRSGVEQVRSRA